MADLGPLLRFWTALDDAFENVERTSWGAVVTDRRFPAIWDVNYARVESTDPSLRIAQVEGALRPALAKSRAAHAHLVIFHPEELTGLLSELGTRGDRISWEIVMEQVEAPPDDPGGVAVGEVSRFDGEHWRRYRDSIREFDVTDERTLDDLVRLERDVVNALGKRWFVVLDGARTMALGSLLVLERVGYVDNVVTFPEARGRGYAGAIATRIVREAHGMGAEHVYLLVDLDGPGRMYERLGFRGVAQIASSLRRLE